MRDAVGWIAEDRDDAASIPVEVDERLAFDTVAAFPADGKTLVGFLDIDGVTSRGESAGGLTPPASRRTVRDTLASYGSHQANAPIPP